MIAANADPNAGIRNIEDRARTLGESAVRSDPTGFSQSDPSSGSQLAILPSATSVTGVNGSIGHAEAIAANCNFLIRNVRAIVFSACCTPKGITKKEPQLETGVPITLRIGPETLDQLASVWLRKRISTKDGTGLSHPAHSRLSGRLNECNSQERTSAPQILMSVLLPLKA